MTSNAADTERVDQLLSMIYESYLAGDTNTIDRCLSTTFTMFDSARVSLVQGHAELDELRAGRTISGTDQPREISITVTDLVVHRWGAVLIAAYLVKVAREEASGVRLPDAAERTTAVLIDESGSLQLVHIHEQPV